MNTSADKSFSRGVQAEINYRLLRIAGEQYGRSPQELSDDQLKRARGIAINELELERLVLSSQEAHQVVISDTDIKAALDEISQRYETAADFSEALARNGLDKASLQQALDRELRVQAVMDLVGSRAPDVDETEVRLFYYLHPEQFNKPETRSVRHILITVNDSYAENSRDAARDRLAAIGKRLRKHPERFAEQALKHSECPTGLHGGSLGEVPQGTLYPELDARLFTMQAGELSEPIASELGWHLLWCESIQAAETVPLANVMPVLREQLQDRQRKKVQKEWLKARASAAAESMNQ
jgi:peptidyl-prolyl cis-trans isomerase C